jgi:hypothetical protein
MQQQQQQQGATYSLDVVFSLSFCAPAKLIIQNNKAGASKSGNTSRTDDAACTREFHNFGASFVLDSRAAGARTKGE